MSTTTAEMADAKHNDKIDTVEVEYTLTFKTLDDEHNGETTAHVGPKMRAALQILARGPKQSKKALAEVVGPNGSLRYGYEVVNRVVKGKLATVESDHEDANPHGAGAVVLTDAGREYLDSLEEA